MAGGVKEQRARRGAEIERTQRIRQTVAMRFGWRVMLQRSGHAEARRLREHRAYRWAVAMKLAGVKHRHEHGEFPSFPWTKVHGNAGEAVMPRVAGYRPYGISASSVPLRHRAIVWLLLTGEVYLAPLRLRAIVPWFVLTCATIFPVIQQYG